MKHDGTTVNSSHDAVLGKGDPWRSMKLFVVLAAATAMYCAGGLKSPANALNVDEILIRPETEPSFWRTHDFAVTIRFTSEEQPERQITLSETNDDVSAEIVEAVGEPLWQQLEHKRTIANIRTVRYRVDDSASLAPLLAEFRHLRVSPVPPGTIYLHPNTLTIWATTAAGSFQFYVVLPPDHGTAKWGEDRIPQMELIEWADNVDRAVRNGRRP